MLCTFIHLIAFISVLLLYLAYHQQPSRTKQTHVQTSKRGNINCGVCTFTVAGVTSSTCAAAGPADTALLTTGSSQTLSISSCYSLCAHLACIGHPESVIPFMPCLLAVLLELQCHYMKIADETLAQANETSFI